MRKIVIAYITPCNYCPFKVKTGRLRDTVPARTCAPGKYQIYCPGGAFDVSPHQAIKRCTNCQPGRLGKYCIQHDLNQPDTTFPIANARDKRINSLQTTMTPVTR